MSLEAIKVVTAAESDAENMRAGAVAEAKRIIAAAEASGKEEILKAEKSATSQVQAFCREAEDKGKESAAKSAEAVREKCLNLESEAEKRMDRAVTIVVERVLSGR